MASNIKQHSNGAIASDSLPFPSPYHTIRHSTVNGQQQSLRNQFPSSPSGEKRSSPKPDVPRSFFQNWSASHGFAKDDHAVKSNQDRQNKKFHNNNHLSMESNIKNKKKQQIIQIEDDEQRGEKQCDKQLRGGNMVIKQNIKNKQIPLQSTQTNPKINNPYQKIDYITHKSLKFINNTSHIQNKSPNDHQNKMVNDNQNTQFNNFKQQTNRQYLPPITSLHEHLSRKQQQLPQRPAFYPTHNSLPYNGLYPQHSPYFHSMNNMNHLNTSDINFPAMMNIGSGSMFNNPSNPMIWGHNLNSYNHAIIPNNYGYVSGLLENGNAVIKPLMDMTHVNLNSYGNDLGMYNANHNKNTVNNQRSDIAYNQKNRIYKDKNLIYSKQPQLISHEPSSNSLAKQSKQRQKISSNQQYRENKYLKAKQHEKRDTASSVNDTKNVQSVIILDSDDQEEGQVDANNKPKQPLAATSASEGRMIHPNNVSYTDVRSMIPQNSLQLHTDINKMNYHNNNNVPMHVDMRSFPVASQYNPAAYQQMPQYAPYSGYPSANNLMRPQEFPQSQPNSHNTPDSGRSYKQHCNLRQQYLDKTKRIQKMRSNFNPKKKIVSEDRQKLAEERIENIGKIREMCFQQQKDLSTLLKHSTKIPNLYNTIKPTLPEKTQLQQNPTMNPFMQQKMMSINNYLNMVKLPNDLRDSNELKQFQHIYNSCLMVNAQQQRQFLNNKGGQSTNAVQGQMGGNNAQSQPKIQPYSSSYPYNMGKEISGTEHVKRQAQKAFEKTRSRIHNQQQTTLKHSLMETYRKSINRKQRRSNDIHDDKTLMNNLSSQISTKLQSSSLQQSSEEKQKQSGYVFQWTPRLKRLRDVSKRRQIDSVILIGPDFQADIPTFVTDQRQLKFIKAVKRAGLLKRFYKHTSQI